MKRAGTIAFFILFLVFIISCRINLPIVEMTGARLLISKAYEVKADKYAPDLLQESEKHLYTSHDFGIKDDIDNAKKEANLSMKLANEAIEKALPLLAGDTLTQAKSAYTDAEKLYAEKFSPEEYTKAGSLISESNGQFDSKAYRESYKTSLNAVKEAESAKEKSLQQIPVLKDETDRLVKSRDDLMAMKGKDAAQDELAKAGDVLAKANDALNTRDLKVAYEGNQQASQYLAAAKNKIVKMSSKERIAALRQEIQTVKSGEGASFAGEDIEVAESSVNEADTLLEQDRTEDSLAKIGDAESALQRAKSKTKGGIANEKLQAAEMHLEKVKSKDTGNKYADEIGKASTLIEEGKQLLASSSYEDSIKKAGDAETILNTLAISGEIGLSKTNIVIGGDVKAVYKVIYNKKHPDCLWRIAQKMYKNAKLWPLIFQANKNIIRDPDLIFPGQQFMIPMVPQHKKQLSGEETQTIEDTTHDKSDTKKEPMKEGEPNMLEKR